MRNIIKENLIKLGYKFYSDTDTEVIAKLIEDMFEKDLITTISKVTQKLVWAYALAIIDTQNPDVLVWTKFGSPMILWIWDKSCFLSSCAKMVNDAKPKIAINIYSLFIFINFEFE